MNDLKKQILKLVERDLAEIEDALKQNLNPYLDLVSQIASHIIFSGGKRLRPLLFVLSTRVCNYQGNNVNKFSTIFEYIHTASLLHDDVVDGATLRRGKAVANSIWGGSTAVLVGDFLFARASSIAAEARSLAVIDILARLIEDMSQGEIDQIIRKGRLGITQEEYLEVIRRKTAVLFQGACRIGAVVSKATGEEEKALSDFGYNLGIAFQMIDDLIDYTSETQVTGKAIGADLKEGKLTLPVIHSLKMANPQDRAFLTDIIKKTDFSAREFEIFIDILGTYEGITYTKQMASEYVESAKEALAIFEPSETKKILKMIADYTLTRNA
ncbi:polyprenyl synthetase family protein [Thermodesulfobacteriota bacterium]